MDYMKLLYRILRMASKAMDLDEIPAASEVYLPDVMKASQNEIESMICKAYEEGYITGVHCLEIDGCVAHKVIMSNSYITPTIKGIEYLSNNSTMKKIASAMRGIKEIIPGA